MKNLDLKVLALSIVGTVLVLLAVGSVIKAASTGEGLDPRCCFCCFCYPWCFGCWGFGNSAVEKNKKLEEDEEY